MQEANWNDLRYLLAVIRGQRLGAAARMLGVDDTTVSRRLAALERATGRRLHQRLADGRLELTEAGAALAAIAERFERDVGALEAGTSSSGAVAGVVRLTSVPFVINRLLVPAAKALLDRHASLCIEFIAEARDLSLTRREADMAVRLARPQTGGLKVKARRVGLLAYAPYVAASVDGPVSRLPWIAYEESMAQLP